MPLSSSISGILPLPNTPVTSCAFFFSAKGAAFFWQAHPVKTIFAFGLSFAARAAVCRDFFSASAVTAQVFMIYKSAGSSSSVTS